jgi:hypothetical protein
MTAQQTLLSVGGCRCQLAWPPAKIPPLLETSEGGQVLEPFADMKKVQAAPTV